MVASIRKEIESLGGEVHFRTKVCDILCEDIAGIKEDEAGKVHEQETTADRQNSQLKGLLIEKDCVRTCLLYTSDIKNFRKYQKKRGVRSGVYRKKESRICSADIKKESALRWHFCFVQLFLLLCPVLYGRCR